MGEPANPDEPRRRMRPVGEEERGVAAPPAVVRHVLGRFGLELAKLDGGSNAGAYAAVPSTVTELSVLSADPVGDNYAYYDVYGFVDEVEVEDDLEVQIYRWLYTLPDHIATTLWPLLLRDPRSSGPHRRRNPAHRPVPFFMTPDFERDLWALTEATGLTREELVEQAVFEMADRSGQLDLLTGEWARRRFRARRGAEPKVGRDQLAPWWLGPGTPRVSAGESVAVPFWPGYPPVAVTAAAPCTGDHAGVWLCVSHNRELVHRGDIERHTSTGDDHRLGWLCREHGLEAPPAR